MKDDRFFRTWLGALALISIALAASLSIKVRYLEEQLDLCQQEVQTWHGAFMRTYEYRAVQLDSVKVRLGRPYYRE
jgi:hypothetical protein